MHTYGDAGACRYALYHGRAWPATHVFDYTKKFVVDRPTLARVPARPGIALRRRTAWLLRTAAGAE